MDREHYSKPRFAVLDLDETLIEGSLGSRIARALLDPRRNKGLIPRRYYLKLLRYAHIPLLSRLRSSYRIYRYIIKNTYRIYLRILSDPDVDRNGLISLINEVIRETPVPQVSINFIRKLKERGYTVVIVTATPQEIAEEIGHRLGVDRVIGSTPSLVLDREGKEIVIRRLAREGSVEIIVGNPKNEPFWLAKRLAVVVRSPSDLKKWLEKI